MKFSILRRIARSLAFRARHWREQPRAIAEQCRPYVSALAAYLQGTIGKPAIEVPHQLAQAEVKAELERARKEALDELDGIENVAPDALTVVIPSKDRTATLGALLQYFANSGLYCRILVLGSGDRYRTLAGQYPSLNIKLMEFDEQTRLPDKLRAGLASIRSPLVALCTDDDIVTHEGLRKAAGFLMQHPAYSACQGYHLQFFAMENCFNLLSYLYFTPSLEQDDPLGRVNALIRRYQPVCWAVFRAEVVQDAAATFSRTSNTLFFELLWSCSAAIRGKVKRLPMAYCLRRADQIHLSGHPLYAMMESPQQFFADYRAYRDILADRISTTVTCSRAELIRILDLMHACYFGRETDTGILNYFTDQILARPAASVHDPEIVERIRPPVPDCETGWLREIAGSGRTYRLFPDFIDAKPKSEVYVRPDFVDRLIADLDGYPLTSEMQEQ